jgi:hypothetical protein
MVRRRENIKFSSTRLAKTAARTLKRRSTQLWDANVIKFAAEHQRQNGMSHANGFSGLKNGLMMNGSGGRARVNEV